MTDIYGRSNDVFPNGIYTNNVSSLDNTADILLDSNEININATSVLVNGIPITGESGFVTNPMSVDLNANDYNITNVGLINGVDIETINSDLTAVKDKTININLPLTFDGTTFTGKIYADNFVTSGGTNQQYVMGDGTTLQYSANSGNSNFYLYNNGTDQDPTPASGFITYNNAIQDNVTIIYISHRTRDNIDIEVFFKNLSKLNDVYIQDQSDSANSILYNITSSPLIVNQAQVSIPVVKTTSAGTGATSFGNGHNILLSFFTNSIEADTRLSALENKTRFQTATSTQTVFTNSTEMRLTSLDRFYTTFDNGIDITTKFSISDTQIISLIPMAMGYEKIINLGNPTADQDAVTKIYVDNTNAALSESITILEGKTQNISAIANETTLSGPLEAQSFTITGGSPFDFLMADGTVTRPENDNGNRVNNVYYDVINGLTTFSLSMESWRYLSWGYIAPAVVSTVDCVSTLMTHQGGSLAITGINAGIAPKGYKIRVGSNVLATANGATSGWLGAAVQNFILPQAGWYIKIGFSLDATAGGTNNRTMIGLFQSNTRPVLDNTTTIASVTTGSLGIVQEKGETTFSFNTRGPSGSTKIPTTISSETPNNNWYTLEMINEARFAKVTLILTSQTPDNTQTATTSFICSGPNTMSVTTAWVHLQQSMASPGGINNSAVLALGNITMKLAQ